MSGKQAEEKKGMPGGFFIFLLAMMLIFLTFKNLGQDQTNHVSFSHQVEHLVNLDMLKKEESRMVAQSESLVTFMGRFRDKLSADGKAKYRFLELLNDKKQLSEKQQGLREEIVGQKARAKMAVENFVALMGIPIPSQGITVIPSSYDRIGEEPSSLKLFSTREANLPEGMPTLPQLNAKLRRGESVGVDAGELIRWIQSNLSLNEEYRAQLDTARKAIEADEPASGENAVDLLNDIKTARVKGKGGIPFAGLTSVRQYRNTLNEYEAIASEIEKKSGEFQAAAKAPAVVGATWFFNNEEISTKSLEAKDPETYATWFKGAKTEWDTFSKHAALSFKVPDQPRNVVLGRTFRSQESSGGMLSYFVYFLPILFVIFILYAVYARQKGGAAGAMTFGKSTAKLMTLEKNKTKFDDVAGCKEAKDELVEIVDFLKDPRKYTNLGARIPKGVLLFGEPGTGKTLIAKAVAGEAGVPFYSISGSDFVEMFVGVGASRVRDMFVQAKRTQPCIIFIDEIDALGRQRGSGMGGGHDEREQTLNQLLVEMDGFDDRESVIIMAATNRAEILDKALLRPGRFDRQVTIDLPDLQGRIDILKVHAKRFVLDESVDLRDIARGMSGHSGASLANVLNEAALLAASNGRKAITSDETLESMDKVRWGKQRHSLEVSEKEKESTAYHESGHAIVAKYCDKAEPVHKVTIIPRGASLGATIFLPEKNRVGYWASELEQQLAVLMGGRVAEELFCNDKSSGAQHDFQQATRIARSMVYSWGMDEDIGPVAYDWQKDIYGQSEGAPISEEMARELNKKVHDILQKGYNLAKKILEEHRDQVEIMTAALIKYETIDEEDVNAIIAGTFDDTVKEKRLQIASERQKGETPPPPPPEENRAPKLGDARPNGQGV